MAKCTLASATVPAPAQFQCRPCSNSAMVWIPANQWLWYNSMLPFMTLISNLQTIVAVNNDNNVLRKKLQRLTQHHGPCSSDMQIIDSVFPSLSFPAMICLWCTHMSLASTRAFCKPQEAQQFTVSTNGYSHTTLYDRVVISIRITGQIPTFFDSEYMTCMLIQRNKQQSACLLLTLM